MPSFLGRLKFAWEYWALRRHRIASNSFESILERLDWHDDPLVGRYVRTDIGTWWADVLLPKLGYDVRLIAPGDTPAIGQIDRFEKLVTSLPELIRESALEPPPEDDGWGVAPPEFDIWTARLSGIRMQSDGSFVVLFDVNQDNGYMLCPLFEVSSDLKLLSAEWSV